jgi:recombination protein RecA
LSTKKAIENLDNLYAKNGIVNLGKNRRIAIKKKTGRPSLDYLTDGGFPTGRLILFAGEKSSGKSSGAIQFSELIGEKILYVDTEYTLTTDYIESLGCNPDNYDHAMPETTEKMCDLIRANVPNYDVIIIDSINNSASYEQLNKNSDEKTMANRASVLSVQLPIIVGLCNQYNTTLIVVSQIRQNMNKANKYDSDTIIPGGESLHHNSSMTLEFYPSTKVKDDGNEFEDKETIGGRLVRIECTKNKVGKPFRKVKVEFLYGLGYTEESDVIAAAEKLNLITNKGAWYYYGETVKCNGRDNLRSTISTNKELYAEIKQKVEEAMVQFLADEDSPALTE